MDMGVSCKTESGLRFKARIFPVRSMHPSRSQNALGSAYRRTRTLGLSSWLRKVQ